MRASNKTPLYIIFFVTSRCNMRCKHCFFWKELNTMPEMSLSQIEKVSKSMDDLLFLRLTGGEPFLRPDIDQIIGIFYNNNSLRNIGINTNGYFVERIVSVVEKVLQRYKINLDICVSIDDLPKEHDKNRGIKGAFSRAIKTIEELNMLKTKYKNLTTSIGLTILSDNQNRLDRIFETIKKANPTFIAANLVRGKPKKIEIKDVNISLYKDFFKRVSDYNNKKSNFYFNAGFKDKLLSNKVSKTFIEKRYQGIKCVAGDKVAVLYSNGDVYPCELLDKKIGNLKKSRYNFRALWESKNRKQIYEEISKGKCFCTHECFLTSSIFFSPQNLLKCMFFR